MHGRSYNRFYRKFDPKCLHRFSYSQIQNGFCIKRQEQIHFNEFLIGHPVFSYLRKRFLEKSTNNQI